MAKRYHGQEASFPRGAEHTWQTPGTELLPTLLDWKDLPHCKKGTELVDKHTHISVL